MACTQRWIRAVRALTVIAALVLLPALFPLRAAAAGAVNVTVEGSQPLGQVPSTAVGINTAVWDGHLQDAVIPGLIQQTGANILRFPGGSTADNYHWQTNTVLGGYANPANTFDNFMRNVVIPSDAQAMITVNYGSNAAGTAGGDPQEAAAWVNYANNVQRYGVKYWEIGNELYGNGYFYGVQWETDLHSTATGSARSGDPNLSPRAYATNSLAFIKAMKAADPSIQVGLVLTAPGNWPDGVNVNGQVWNPTVLSTACRAADFVSVHWYAQQPGQESDQGLLAAPYAGTQSTPSIPSMVSKLRSEINQYCGAHAPQVAIMVTETNSVAYNPGKQTTSPINGLFLMENYLEWLQNGVQNVSWWDLHNSPVTWGNNSPLLAGTTNYGDYGLLSNGDPLEPPANTPFPTYTALTLLHQALAPGSIFLRASSALPAVHVYALRQPAGHLAMVLINTSSTDSYTINAAVQSLDTAASGTATSFSLASPQLTPTSVSVARGQVSLTMAPYSATVVELTRGGS